jgi:hypothetical protein
MVNGDGERATDEEVRGSDDDDCSSKMIPRKKNVPFSLSLRGTSDLSTASDPFHHDVSPRCMCDVRGP